MNGKALSGHEVLFRQTTPNEQTGESFVINLTQIGLNSLQIKNSEVYRYGEKM